MTPALEAFLQQLGTTPLRLDTEKLVQRAIAELLAQAGVAFRREVALTKSDIIDFLCGPVGIEVKISGVTATVTRQLWRYAESPLIEELVLVTSVPRHAQIARSGSLREKPLSTVVLYGSLL